MSSADLDVYKEWLGIPAGPRPPDHYQLLRLVQFEDDPEKVRKHYKKLNGEVRKYAAGKHSVRSQELLNELAKAMLCLTDVERKREYDESQGREFEDEDTGERKPLEVLLMQRKIISKSQVEEARERVEKTGLDMRDAVVQLKFCDQSTATQAYAEELGLPFIDLTELTPDDSILDQVPRQLVKTHSILPLFVDDDVLLVACTHPPEHDLEEELRLRLNCPVRGVLAVPLQINQGIAKYYAPGARAEAAPSSKGGKAPAGSSAARASAPRSYALTPEQIKERKAIGLIVMCWTFIPCVLLDLYVLPSFMPKFVMKFYFLLTFIFPPFVSFVVWSTCFQKK